MRYLGLLLVIIALMSSPVQAQAGGQFCVRAFEDRNGNGQLDGGEPFLTRGVSANLLNVDEVTVASALLDDSPTAAQGVICFQFLEPGQYTLSISTADYTPTTPSSFTATISAGTLPTVVQFGGERISAAPVAVATPAEPGIFDQENLPRIVLAALGMLIVIAAMVVLGALIYALAFRSRRPARPYYVPQQPGVDPRVATGQTNKIITIGEDDYIPDMPDDMAIRPDTPTPGSVPIITIEDDTFSDEDTDQIKPI